MVGCSSPGASDNLETAEGTEALSRGRLFSENFEQATGSDWADSSQHGQWTSVWNGYGHNGVVQSSSVNKVLRIMPQAVTDPSQTSSSLVVANTSFGDLDLYIDVKTVKQLRTPTPNPWEVGWVLFGYTDNAHFYALVLKPNGWELDKEDPAYPGNQRFLATGSSPTFPVGVWRHVRITKVGNSISVSVNGQPLTSFVDQERPYTSGTIAAYAEDSQVFYDSIVVRSPN